MQTPCILFINSSLFFPNLNFPAERFLSMSEQSVPYYGRSCGGQPPYQTVQEHLQETASLMEEFCSKFTCPEIGYVCGLLHDIGKYSDDFQKRVRGFPVKADHSTAGAKSAAEFSKTASGKSKLAYSLISYAVAGHHAGLPDGGNANAPDTTLYQRLQNCDLNLYSAWKNEIDNPFINLDAFQDGFTYSDEKELAFSFFLYTHFLFSALVDADRTSAQAFSGWLPQKTYPSLSEMQETLEKYMGEMFGSAKGELNKIRGDILNSCRSAGKLPPGMFTLTVPTGGGKTLSSLTFALTHAVENNLDRIIYTIPFTSIIEQNAAVYKTIFGENNVIEHHSNFLLPKSEPGDNDSPEKENAKLALSVSNWDAPLILTTNVQFFESLFSAHPSRSRKVHNIANSVIILDEVQALPNTLLRPCLFALAELVKNYNCTVVLCTATQPDFLENKLIPPIKLTNIVENYPELFEKMKRVESTCLGIKNVDELAFRIREERQCLCIVNSKKHARELYASIGESEENFHLSTNMYPEHRKKVLAEIRQKLKNDEPCRLISTQLIEAGVDVDFPVVYRSLSGVDSLQQAAGRCNREGKLPEYGKFFVFIPAERKYAASPYLEQTAGVSATLSDRNYLSLDTVKAYFKELFSIRSGSMDEPDILALCKAALQANPPNYPFRTISSLFKMIADEGSAVVIPNTVEARKLLALADETNIGFIQTKISPYCVNIRENKLDELYEAGALEVIADAFVVLKNPEYYNTKTGLNI